MQHHTHIKPSSPPTDALFSAVLHDNHASRLVSRIVTLMPVPHGLHRHSIPTHAVSNTNWQITLKFLSLLVSRAMQAHIYLARLWMEMKMLSIFLVNLVV